MRKRHFLAVTNLSESLKKILAKHEANVYCLNCVYSFKTTNKLDLYEKVCVNHNFYQIVLPSKKSGYSNVKESW